MPFLAALVVLSVTSVFSGSTQQDVRFVKPSNMSTDCLHRLCLTLDQYAQQPETYFTTGSTFVFLAGNHSLQATVNITSTSDVTLKAETNDSRVNIACTNRVSIFCDTVTNLTIQGLTFLLESNGILQDSSALHFFNCRETLISSTMFLGSGNVTKKLVRGIYSLFSDLSIVSCRFEGNTGDYGGAIYASEGSNINLTGNTFITNTAKYTGGAIHVEKSSIITLKERLGNIFINNSGRISGGALNCKNSKFNMELHGSPPTDIPEAMVVMFNETAPIPGIQYFANNKGEHGGAVYLFDSLTFLEGTSIVFRDNSALRGGGMFMYSTGQSIAGRTVVITEVQHLYFTGNRATESGGAIYSLRSFLTLRTITNVSRYYFSKNSAEVEGGAVYSEYGKTTLTGCSIFEENSVSTSSSSGGAISILGGSFILSGPARFQNNKAEGAWWGDYFNSLQCIN